MRLFRLLLSFDALFTQACAGQSNVGPQLPELRSGMRFVPRYNANLPHLRG